MRRVETPDRPGNGGSTALDRWAWLLFVFLAAGFFWEVLFGSGGARRYFWDDFFEFVYPTRHFAAVSLSQGKIPFWNPYVFAGMPFLADIQSAVLYPPNLLLTLFVRGGRLSLGAVEALTVAHYAVAGIAMYLFVRQLGVSLCGALVSGIVFMFSGFLVTHAMHLNVLGVAVWLPLAFLCLHRAFTRSRALYGVLAGGVMAVAFLGGSPQVLLLGFIGLGAFTAYATGLEIRRQPGFSFSRLRPSFFGLLALGFSIGLCLFQLVPSYELSRLSVRPELTYAQSVEASFPPQNLVTFFIPRFFGDTNGGDFGVYWGAGRYYYFWELSGYVGVVGLLMAWVGARRSQRPWRGFWIGLTLLALLLAGGRYGGIHHLLFAALPGYDRFRIPARALLLVVLAVSVLAGYGAEVLTSGTGKAREPWLARLARGWTLFSAAVLVAASVMFWKMGLGRVLLSGRTLDWPYFAVRALPFVLFAGLGALLLTARHRGLLTGRAAGGVILVLITADLFVFGRGHNLGRQGPDAYYRRGEVLEIFRPDEGEPLYRVQSRGPHGEMIIRRNQGEIDGVFNVDGYNQLKLALYETFDVGRDRKLDLLNTRYRVEPGAEEGELQVVESGSYLPRVWVAPDTLLVGGDAEALERMKREEFDPRRTVVLTEPVSWDGGAGPASGTSRADLVSYDINRIEAEAELDGRGMVMFSEVYYPSWKAAVDGRPRPVARADYALRGIPVEAGIHRVVLSYDPSAFWRGLLLSGFVFSGGVGFVVWSRGRRRG